MMWQAYLAYLMATVSWRLGGSVWTDVTSTVVFFLRCVLGLPIGDVRHGKGGSVSLLS